MNTDAVTPYGVHHGLVDGVSEKYSRGDLVEVQGIPVGVGLGVKLWGLRFGCSFEFRRSTGSERASV